MATRSIEINFGQPINLTREEEIALVELAGQICDRYERDNPGRIMWPFGVGSKMLTNSVMASDDEPLEFDESVFQEVALMDIERKVALIVRRDCIDVSKEAR